MVCWLVAASAPGVLGALGGLGGWKRPFAPPRDGERVWDGEALGAEAVAGWRGENGGSGEDGGVSDVVGGPAAVDESEPPAGDESEPVDVCPPLWTLCGAPGVEEALPDGEPDTERHGGAVCQA